MPADPTALIAWLLNDSRSLPGIGPFIDGLAARLVAEGLPLSRLGSSLRTLHPEVFVEAVRWSRGKPAAVSLEPHDILYGEDYLTSPVRIVREERRSLRRRLAGPDAQLDFPQLAALARGGATDYFILPLMQSEQASYLSIATDAPEGFSDDQLALMEAIRPALDLRLDLESTQRATRSLLQVYAGEHAARRILAGEFRRGGGQKIGAVLWTCDLRGFTPLVDSRPMDEVLHVLDRYFDATAGAVLDHGGDVLKFIGDAVLAIFPLAPDPADACARALTAARQALETIATLSRAEGSTRALSAGIALHLGEVTFGNIGTRGRLDFTVIGAVVNEATRLESLCKPLGVPLVLSREFVRVAQADTASLGVHALKGVSEPREVFTLRTLAPPARGSVR